VVIKTRKITIELDEETYKKLVEQAEKEGYSIITDYIIYLIKRSIAGEEPVSLNHIIKKLKPRIERIVQDETSKYLMLINEIRGKIAELQERIEQLSMEIDGLKKQLEQQPSVKPKQATRKTGIERLREEKVVFESNLPPRLRRDRFFNYLEREGAVILPLSKERVAVDPDYWEEFKKKLFEELNTSNEEAIRKILGSPGYELFMKLKEESLIYYDPRQKKWLPASKEYFK